MSLRILLLLLTAWCLTASAQVKVAIFSVNDFHASFVRNDAKGIAGAPALWQTLDSLKRVYPLHVTVSAGDNFGGSFFYNATNGALMPVLFNGLGIRLSAVGHRTHPGLCPTRGLGAHDAAGRQTAARGLRGTHYLVDPGTGQQTTADGTELRRTLRGGARLCDAAAGSIAREGRANPRAAHAHRLLYGR